MKDQKEIFLLIADYRRTLEKVLASPDTLSMDASRELLEELESLKARFAAHTTGEASKWLDSIEEKGINRVCSSRLGY